MTQLLINNTEQIQPDERDDTIIVLHGRPPENPEERVEVRVFGFDPYFYVLNEEAREREQELLQQDCIERIEYDVGTSFKEQKSLALIEPPYPQDTREARDLFDQHWSADVPFTNRFRVDSGVRAAIEIPDSTAETGVYDVHWREINPVEPGEEDVNPGGEAVQTGLQNVGPRVVTLDIEVDDRGGFPEAGEERILSIVAHDSYQDEIVAWYDADGRDPDELIQEAPGEIDRAHLPAEEREMLVQFVEWFNEMDPDLVTGWNVDDFDIPHIIKRLDNLGINSSSLSPLGWSGITRGDEPRIKGRTIYDLLTVYKKNRFTELRSYSLDYVAGEELDAEKITFDGSYFDLYQDDPATFLRYNAHDVDLTVRINEEAGVIEFRDVLRREVGVDFEDSYDNKDFVDMMCRRKLKEIGLVGPSRPDYGDAPDSDYEGAKVFDAYKGVAENVVGVDLASLYPYTMAMLNASPETKVDDNTERPFNVAHAANGQDFRLDQDGLFKQLVDEAIGLKSEYKDLRESAEDDEEYEYWGERYNVAKTLTNSLYGVTGWERFFLYDEAVAEAVTLTGQAVISQTAEYVAGCGYEVLYGDTDSTYVKFPDEWTPERCVETAQELCGDLNDHIYPELAKEHGIPTHDNLWEIEVEVHMVRYFQAGKKKRYAYVATWKGGRWLDGADVSITGFASKRSDSSQLTMETEKAVLDAILSGDEDAVSEIVFEAATKIEPTQPEWELIGIPGGMNKKVTDDPETANSDQYYAVSCDSNDNCYPQDAHPRAVYNSNKILDVNIDSSEKPRRVYIKPHWFDEVNRDVDVLAFEEGRDMEPVEDKVTVDVPRMTTTLLVNPLERICDAVGVDVGAAVRGQEQTNLGAF